MKQECPTYIKTIGKSKALIATMSDSKPEDDSNDNDDEGILNAFTATVDPTDEGSEIVDDEEDLVDSKFEKMNEQDDIHTAYAKLYKVSEKHEKLYKMATKKLSDVELDWEELSTKFDEANQTIRALRFENNFLAEKKKKLETELLQVRAQLERTSSAKLNAMLSFQKSASNKMITTVFVSPANNVNFENNECKTNIASKNIEKGKSMLGAPLKLEKKETRNLRTKKGNNQKSK